MEKAERYEAEGASECFVAAAFLQNLMGMPTSLTALSVTRVYVCWGGVGGGGGCACIRTTKYIKRFAFIRQKIIKINQYG